MSRYLPDETGSTIKAAVTAVICTLLGPFLPEPALAQQDRPLADTNQIVALAKLCLAMENLKQSDVIALARTNDLEPEEDPLARLEQHFSHRNDVKAVNFGHTKGVDPKKAARQTLFPMKNPYPLLSFRGANGWLFLVGLNVPGGTIGGVPFTHHSCHIIGIGWVPDSAARVALAEVLGEDYSGSKTTPPEVLNDHPVTTALGANNPLHPTQVNFLIESWRGADSLVPITASSISTAPEMRSN